MEASDKTPIECVQEVDEERTRLEEEIEWMMTEDPENPRLNQVRNSPAKLFLESHFQGKRIFHTKLMFFTIICI
jgi:ATP-binding cassette subfamily F protein 2